MMDGYIWVGKAIASLALCGVAAFVSTIVPPNEAGSMMVFAIVGLVIIW